MKCEKCKDIGWILINDETVKCDIIDCKNSGNTLISLPIELFEKIKPVDIKFPKIEVTCGYMLYPCGKFH